MPKLLIIGYVWPEPTSSAAGTRMMQLIDFFKNENYQVIFGTTARETENKADLAALGVKTEKIKLNDPEFDDLLKKLMPEMVLFDRFMMEEQFGWRVDNICPNAIKILDTEDLHFLRKARQEAFKTNKNTEDLIFNSEEAKREIAAIYRCDLSLVISEVEMELLIKKFKIPNEILLYLPFMLQSVPEKIQAELPKFEDRKDFISIGNFLHEPNWNAVLVLKEKIWPQIRKQLPKAKMNIYGAYPSEKVKNLHNEKENFIVHGWTEDSAKVMKNSKVCLAPIQFGAGLKGKLVEAMQNGTPSITTKIGAEGINGNMEWNGHISDSLEDFIDEAVNIYNNETIWNTYQEAGFKIINERFNITEHQNSLGDKIQKIKKDLDKHRAMNFTGSMLKYHLHKSTYFMSRFIEEKNKRK